MSGEKSTSCKEALQERQQQLIKNFEIQMQAFFNYRAENCKRHDTLSLGHISSFQRELSYLKNSQQMIIGRIVTKILRALPGGEKIVNYLTNKVSDRRVSREIQTLRESKFFDEKFYLEKYPDVRESGFDPVYHYVTFGWKELRDPSPFFSTQQYLAANPDVVISGHNPFCHWITLGQTENRPLFLNESLDNSTLFATVKDFFPGDVYENKAPSAVPDSPLKLIAFYLPQFHQIPENDAWWGEGFTEWTNVRKALPLFIGHEQPKVPGEFGYYDLDDVTIMKRQAELAKEFGLSGFCFHHYYFSGKRLLQKPVDNWLAHPEIDFPFCLCWANENWTRRWDGLENEILIAQEHSPKDDIRFLTDIERYFEDSRYIRVDGKPLLIVYKANQLPDIAATIRRWREHRKSKGLSDLYLVMAQTFGATNPQPYGFDAAVEFPPHVGVAAENIKHFMPGLMPEFEGSIFDYRRIPPLHKDTKADFTLFKTVFPAWDNTPRRGTSSSLFAFSTPELYAKWLESALLYASKNLPGEQQITFINAWNEWAEGAYLEPDTHFGYAYLNATSRTLAKVARRSCRKGKLDLAVLMHVYYEDMLPTLLDFIKNIPEPFDLLLSVPEGKKAGFEQAIVSAGVVPGQVVIKEVPNTGYDIGPMFFAFAEDILSYDLVCKIHSKKGQFHTYANQDWGQWLLEGVLGDKDMVATIIQDFRDNENLGLIFPKPYPPIEDKMIYWGHSYRQAARIMQNLGGVLDESSRIFPAGSMFWVRPEAISSLLGQRFDERDFAREEDVIRDEETGHVVDGTLAHAIERVFPHAVRHAGYHWKVNHHIQQDHPSLERAQTGYCPVCRSSTIFTASQSWLRDHYKCVRCSSLPRSRAVHKVLESVISDWSNVKALELAPLNSCLENKVEHYIGSCYYPDKEWNTEVNGLINQDAENMTFPENSFDLIIHEDILEHLFDPEKGVREMLRVLAPGGNMIFAVPMHNSLQETQQRALRTANGTVEHKQPAEYHAEQFLVTYDYGQDFPKMLQKWCEGLEVTVEHYDKQDCELGIEGDYLDVFRIHDTRSKRILDVFKNYDDDAWRNTLTFSVTSSVINGVQFPGFPDESIQKNMVGSSNEHALSEAYLFYIQLKKYISQWKPVSECTLLDFGCGWGRNYRFFLKDLPPERIVGIDCDKDFIDICHQIHPEGRYEFIETTPPTRFEDGSFDVVYSYSVFSHLAEETAKQWIMEFHRLLREDGLLLITTHSFHFLDFCQEVKNNPEQRSSVWHESLAASDFTDKDKCKKMYKSGDFLFTGTGGGGVRTSDFYGEAIISKAYAKKAWSQWFRVVDFFDDKSILPQAMIVLQRK